jgi:hypothetical protein
MGLVFGLAACVAREPSELAADGGESSRRDSLLLPFAEVLSERELAGRELGSGVAKTHLISSVPCNAQEPIQLQHKLANLSVQMQLRDVASASCERFGKLTVYAQAGPGGSDLLVRESAGIVEDFLRWRSPASGEVSYDLTLRGVRGIRLQQDVLELYDRAGSARLRIARPYVIDAKKQRRWAKLELADCAYAASQAAALPAPGSTQCVLRVSWSDEGLQYPIILDPVASSTEHLAHPRIWHTATLLRDGRVLVAGGMGVLNSPLDSTEIYTPSAVPDEPGSWSQGPTMKEKRCLHTATLTQGRVLIVGGTRGTHCTFDEPVMDVESLDPALIPAASAELLDPTKVAWVYESELSLRHPRVRHSATALDNNAIVLLGGGDADVTELSLGDATQRTRTTYELNSVPRFGHAAIAANGRVIVMGGASDPKLTQPLKSVAAYDVIQHRWEPMEDMSQPRVGHTAVYLPKQDHSPAMILVTGADNTAETLEPIAGRKWKPTGNQPKFLRIYHTAAVLQPVPEQAYVFVTGGEYSSSVYDKSELYNGEWLPSSIQLTKARSGHTATVLDDQRTVLIVGGHSRESSPLADTEQIRISAPGQSCSDDSQCVSGLCTMAGVCCNTACERACETCLASEGAPSDGRCGPRKDGWTCRLESDCTQAVACDGIQLLCPAAQPRPDGDMCTTGSVSEGICGGGVCEPKPPTGELTMGGPKRATAFTCSLGSGPTRRSAHGVLSWLLLLCIGAARRSARRTWAVVAVSTALTHAVSGCKVDVDWVDAGPMRDAGPRDAGVDAGASIVCTSDDPVAVEVTTRAIDAAASDPGPRRFHAAQSWRDGVILFGGIRGAELLADTWFRTDASGWTQLEAPGPAPRVAPAISTTSERDTLLLFGGRTAAGEARDTWLWNASWTRICDVGQACIAPPARSGHSMVYDPVSQKVLLTGGTADGNALADTWEWSKEEGWVERCGPIAPCVFGARYDHGMVFDESIGRVLMLGGTNGSFHWSDVWEWSGGGWQWRSGIPEPLGSRLGTAMAFDTKRQLTVVFTLAEAPNKSVSDIWAYIARSDRWLRATLGGDALQAPSNTALAWDRPQHRLLAQGGGRLLELAGTWILDTLLLSPETYCSCLDQCLGCTDPESCRTRCELPSNTVGQSVCSPLDAGSEDAGTEDDGGTDPMLSRPCTNVMSCCSALTDSRDDCRRTAEYNDLKFCSALEGLACKGGRLSVESAEARDCWQLAACCIGLSGSLRYSCMSSVQEDPSCGGFLRGGFCSGDP